MKKQPRPLHATITAIEYRETKDIKKLYALYNILISNYVLNGFLFNGQFLSTEQFSIKLQIPQELVLKGITSAANTFKDFISQDNAQDTFRALSGMALNHSLSDRGLVAQQLSLLTASQGGSYKPFISSSVNQALDLMMKSNDRLISVMQAVFGKDSGTTINILNQQNQNEKDAMLTTDKAIGLLSNTDLTQLPGHTTKADIFEKHVKDHSPEVRAIVTELDAVENPIQEVNIGLITEHEDIPN